MGATMETAYWTDLMRKLVEAHEQMVTDAGR